MNAMTLSQEEMRAPVSQGMHPHRAQAARIRIAAAARAVIA
jgi:hypothetical protein